MKFICKNCSVEFERYPSLPHDYCNRACYDAKPYNKIHGQSHSPEYVSWRHMKQRCSNPKRRDYQWYGAKGIKVCERWMTFANFIEDMGLRPAPEYTLERNDSKLDYGPDNCRWATKLEQARNKSNTYTNAQDQVIRDGIGRGMNFAQIAPLLGKKPHAVASRAYRIGLKSGQPMQQKV
jgi:hypothetical protein